MNVLIFTNADATALVASQHGQHRLEPVLLADGRRFLKADVLDEPLFAGRLDNVPYTIATLADILDLQVASGEQDL